MQLCNYHHSQDIQRVHYLSKSFWCAKLLQFCPTFCDLMDCSPPGCSVHGILQARILEWVVIPSPGDLSNPGIKPRSSALQTDSLLSEPPGIYHLKMYHFK